MKKIAMVFLGFVCTAGAAQYDAAVSVVNNYGQWGWDSVFVMQNDLVTAAMVPSIGGRIIQYNLGAATLLWRNGALTGETYIPATGHASYLFGGFKNWPAPQSSWNTSDWNGWPPPAHLDYGKYACTVTGSSADSVVVRAQSPVETFYPGNLNGLQFVRSMTMYRYTTRLRVEQTLINTAGAKTTWSIWDVTNVIGEHPGQKDYGNFWFYFPKRSKAPADSSGFFILQQAAALDSGATSQQYKPNIRPGISALEYLKHGGKIGVNTDRGWIAAVDERDGNAYVKKFTVFPGKTYPDSGSVVQLYFTGTVDSPYIEMEVLSPSTDLAPNGGSYTFVIDWYATKTKGPIIDVNAAGAVHERLARSGGMFTGKYGVFYKGRLDLVYDNNATAAKSYPVSPLDSVVISESNTNPAQATKASLVLYDDANRLVGTLDSMTLNPAAVGIAAVQGVEMFSVRISDRLYFTVPEIGKFTARVFTLNGSTVMQMQGSKAGDQAIDIKELKTGVYLFSITSGDKSYSKKIYLVR